MPRFGNIPDEQVEESLFRDPAGTMRWLGNVARDEALAHGKAYLDQREAADKFRKTFFSHYPELRSDPEVFTYVLAHHGNDLLNMTFEDGMHTLARRCKERIAHIARHRAEERERAVMVGGPGDEDGTGYFHDPSMIETKTRTLSDTIKERREARRQAQFGRRARTA